MSNSKSEKIREFILDRAERAINDIIAENVNSNSATAGMLKSQKDYLKQRIASACSYGYDVMELNDIMHWKKPKRVD